jgi:hypothetical protein
MYDGFDSWMLQQIITPHLWSFCHISKSFNWKNWWINYLQAYGGAGNQFSIPPFPQPPIVKHPTSRQSSDPSPTRAEGSQVNSSNKFNLQFLIINMSVLLLLQGSGTGAQARSMPSGSTGGQMMSWYLPCQAWRSGRRCKHKCRHRCCGDFLLEGNHTHQERYIKFDLRCFHLLCCLESYSM